MTDEIAEILDEAAESYRVVMADRSSPLEERIAANEEMARRTISWWAGTPQELMREPSPPLSQEAKAAPIRMEKAEGGGGIYWYALPAHLSPDFAEVVRGEILDRAGLEVAEEEIISLLAERGLR